MRLIEARGVFLAMACLGLAIASQACADDGMPPPAGIGDDPNLSRGAGTSTGGGGGSPGGGGSGGAAGGATNENGSGIPNMGATFAEVEQSRGRGISGATGLGSDGLGPGAGGVPAPSGGGVPTGGGIPGAAGGSAGPGAGGGSGTFP